MQPSEIDNKELKRIAYFLRLKTLQSVYKSGSGHIGSSLSIAEILSCLFFKYLNLTNEKNNNDKFILSKGHSAPILYAVYEQLKLITFDELLSLRKIESRLQGHPDKVRFKFLDSGSGALGQGLSISIGYALANKLRKNNLKSFCIIGDGEMQEGQIWEAAMYAGSNNLNNLCTIVDSNKFQNEKSIKETLNFYPIKDKWISFGWNCLEINGHSVEEISSALDKFSKIDSQNPTVIIANTIKGSGVDFMENNNIWHSKALSKNDFENASAQLEKSINDIN